MIYSPKNIIILIKARRDSHEYLYSGAMDRGFTFQEFQEWFPALENGFYIGKIPKSDGTNSISILFKKKPFFTIATRREEDVTPEWIKNEISLFKKKEGMSGKHALNLIRAIRGIFWMSPVATFIIFLESAPTSTTSFKSDIMLTAVCVVGLFIIPGLLYSSKEEFILRKQIKDIITIAVTAVFFFGLYFYLLHIGWF